MFKSYFTLAFRNFKKYRTFTFINILGLSIGIASSLLVYRWVQDELSYDRFHPHIEQLFRISNKIKDSFHINTPTLLSDYLQEEIAGVRKTADAQWSGQTVFIRQGDEVMEEEGFMYVEPEFLDIFDFPLLEGVDSLVLVRPFTVVLTPEMAEKYFPNISPVGQRLILTDETEYEVTGVVSPPPSNSSIRFNFLSPAADLEPMHVADASGWISGTGFTYVLTEAGYTKEQLMADIQSITKRYDAPADIWDFTVEPLKDIHLHSDFDKPDGVQGDIRYVYIFLAIGLLILCIACFNYINLATARSLERAKEVGVRKAAGASHAQLVSQFMSESLLITVLAAGVGYVLAWLALPTLNALSHKNLSLNLLDDPQLLGVSLLLILLVTGLAGLYPSFIVAAFRPVDSLKNQVLRQPGGGGILRQMLVVFQFAASAMLVIGTVVVWQQLTYIRHYDLGFDQEQVLKIKHPQVDYDDFLALKNEFTQLPGVVGVTSAPMQRYSSSWFIQSDSTQELFDMQAFNVDADFFALLRVSLAQGRSFHPESLSDLRKSVILSPEAVEAYGLTDPVGKKVKVMMQNEATNEYAFEEKEVIGVLSNQVHFRSFKEATDPFVIQSGTYLGDVLIKVSTNNIATTLDRIRAQWQSLNSGLPFNYSFLDDTYAKLYEQDQRLGRLFIIFAAAALFIAGLGLIGLSSYATQRRTKEIGIRKVLGASVGHLLLLLSSDAIRLITISLVIAVPIANYFVQEWLASYRTRIDINVWIYALPAVAILLIALLTISTQTLRAATRNPVDSLRDE